MNSVSQGIDALAITRVVIRPVGQTKPGVTPQVTLSHCFVLTPIVHILFLSASHSGDNGLFFVIHGYQAHRDVLRDSQKTTISAMFHDVVYCLCVLQGRQFERVFSGNGADEDVVVGSARAYISALNKLISYYSASKQVSTGQESQNGVHKQQQVAV